MELTRIDTVVQFTLGTSTLWNNPSVPVPAGAIAIDTANKIIKEGDGTTLFASLPVCLDYNFHSDTSGAITPEGDHVGTFAIADDQSYSPAGITLQSILDKLVLLNTKSATQQGRIDGANLLNNVGTVGEEIVDGTLVICQNNKYVPGDKTLVQLIADLAAQANNNNARMHITDLEWYTDSGLTNKLANQNNLSENNTYWCKITGFHDIAELSRVDFGMATTNNNITITNSKKEETCAIIAAVYGGTGSDIFTGVTVDSNDNIICVGYTGSEGAGNYDGLVVKFDNNLNIIARKIYGGSIGDDQFTGVAVDSNDSIICCGYTRSEGNNQEALVIKFDSSLNIIARKRYGGSSNDIFYNVTCDSQNNIICVGHTYSEGTGSTTYANILIVKFDNTLTIIARKIYGGANDDIFYSVTTDSNDNIICVGMTRSEGIGAIAYPNALIVKFNSSLNIIARKIYGGSIGDYFNGVVIDNSDNIYAVGNTTSEGAGNDDALIVKFDSSLNIITKKRYGGSGGEFFHNTIIDTLGNIYAVGNTTSEGAGNDDALIVKFDSSLNIITKKRYGGSGGEFFNSVTIDTLGNIYAVGNTTSEGAGNDNALIIKLTSNIPSGAITGTVLTGLTLVDSNLTLADSNLTLADSNLTLANSTLTLNNSTLTLADSTLTFEKDILVAARYTEPTELITTIYSSTSVDKFIANTIDADGNIIAVGLTTVGGTECALVVKFDNTFTAIARKIFNGNFAQAFNSVVTDTNKDIICVGRYSTSSGGANEAFLVKFSSDLTSVIIQKTYGATGDDVFNDIVTDTSGNIIIVGYTSSEGSGNRDGLIVKFNSAFTVLYRKRYGGINAEEFTSVTLDAIGNVIVVGYTSSEGTNTSGLVLKLDANLNIVLRKYYNSTLGTTTEFQSVVVTSTNTIFCVGRIITATGNKGLIVKFDSNINTTGSKLYGNDIGSTEFTGVKVDSLFNIFVVGKTNAEGAGNFDALIMKFDNNLNVKGRKTYGTVGEDADIDCVIDGDDNVIISGYSVIGNSTDAMITKVPNSLPEGLYSNKFIVDLILSDSKLILSDDIGTVGNSTTAMADSTLILSNGSMSISNASGAIVKDITIMDAVSNVFKVRVGNVVATENQVPITFNITTDDGDETRAKDIGINIKPSVILEAAYGGSDHDYFTGVTIDSNDNIICCGYTNSEGIGSVTYSNCLVVKFDSSLNILARKVYGGSLIDQFTCITTDSYDNIICAGYTASEENFGIIVKFDNNLNIIIRKRIGLSGYYSYIYDITTDSNDNIICTGYISQAASTTANALIVKFDSSLNILFQKYYIGSSGDIFYGVKVDSNDNIICVGWTYSEGIGATTYNNALVIKFDSSLNIIARKVYGGASYDSFNKLTIDSNDNIICVGVTTSEGLGSNEAFVIKFDSSLNIVARKQYGGTGDDQFININIDSNDNIICVGITYSEGVTGNCLIVKFNNNLSLISRKHVGGTSNDAFNGVVTDSNDNIICAGYVLSKSGVKNDAIVVKFPPNLPSGTLVGTSLTNLFFNDSALTIADSALTLADSNLTLGDSTLTLAYSNLTLADSALTLEKDTITI